MAECEGEVMDLTEEQLKKLDSERYKMFACIFASIIIILGAYFAIATYASGLLYYCNSSTVAVIIFMAVLIIFMTFGDRAKKIIGEV